MLVALDLVDGTSSSANRPPRRPRPSGAATRARTRPDPRARRPTARRRSRPSRPSTRAGTSPPAAGWGSASRAWCRRPSGRRAERPRPASPSRAAPGSSTRRRPRRRGRRRPPRPRGTPHDRREARRAEPVDGHARHRVGQPASSAPSARRCGCPRPPGSRSRSRRPRSRPPGRRALDRGRDRDRRQVVRPRRPRARRRNARPGCGRPRGRAGSPANLADEVDAPPARRKTPSDSARRREPATACRPSSP